MSYEIDIKQEMKKLLGFKVRDRVTEIEGVVTSVSCDLYGCVHGFVRIPPGKDAKKEDWDNGMWMDSKRLIVISKHPVMEQPDFLVSSAPVRVQGAERKAAPPQ